MAEDPYRYFRIEARELVEKLGQDALELDKAPSPQLVARLLRHAHTLKGAARVVRQLRIADAANRVEEILAPLREGAQLASEQVDAILAQLDLVPPLLRVLDEPPAPPAETPSAAAHARSSGEVANDVRAARLRAPPAADNAAHVPLPGSRAPREEAAPDSGAHAELAPRSLLHAAAETLTVRADVAEVDLVVDGVTGALTELTSLRTQIGKLDDLRQLADSVARQMGGPRKIELRPGDRSFESARSLAESLSRSCRLLEGQLTASLERAHQELQAVRGHAEQLRLSPASTMFNSLERAARDAANELAKPVSIETRGGEIRLDGSVLELVQSAFFHVVRNAVAHGIEPAAERVAANKPPQASIRIEVRRAGRRVAFSCRDDGAGIDVEAVREALRRAGKSDVDVLSPQQVLEQLLESGVSTVSQVTAIAGRGVGLDVLREAAERLSGTVRFDSQRGRGLLVELVVPLSIAAVEALQVESGGRRISLPLESVTQSVRLQDADVARTASGQSVVHEGQVIPFLPLARALRGQELHGRHGRLTAVIVRSSAGSLALGVDRVVGTRTLVLRRLPALLPRSPLLAGAALDELGNPELVLDPDALHAEASQPARALAAAAKPLPILIIDDSLTTRMLEQSILESAGYRVALASSAEEGLQKAQRDAYGLFLVDVEMPGMDGFSFVELTQKSAELRHTPAVLVSSRDAPEDFARGKAAGARGYVVKSRFDQRELLSLIGKLLGKT